MYNRMESQKFKLEKNKLHNPHHLLICYVWNVILKFFCSNVNNNKERRGREEIRSLFKCETLKQPVISTASSACCRTGRGFSASAPLTFWTRSLFVWGLSYTS